MQEPVVEAEHGDDAVVIVERRAQRGMVVHAQIAPEPDESGHRLKVRASESGRLAAPPGGPTSPAL